MKTYETDPDSLLPGVVDDLATVAHVWRLDTDLDSANQIAGGLGAELKQPFDVLEVLKITTRAIRSIRNYLVSLPDESAGTIRAHFRPKLLGPGKPQPNTVPASSSARPDPLTLIRRSALEVLTVLRALEETCRLPLSDGAYDAHSDGGGHSRMASPSNRDEELPPDEDSVELEMPGLEADTSVTFSLVQVQGRYESVPVWEDEDDGSFVVGLAEDEEKEKREHWDERLVLGSGWLYRQDVTLEELSKERKVVGAYLDVVDEVLFGWKKEEGKERGWERERRKAVEKGDRGLSRTKNRRVSAVDSSGTRGLDVFLEESRRRVSTGMLDMSSMSEEPENMGGIEEAEERVDDEELPPWAQRSSFVDDEIGNRSLADCPLSLTWLHQVGRMRYFPPSCLRISLKSWTLHPRAQRFSAASPRGSSYASPTIRACGNRGILGAMSAGTASTTSLLSRRPSRRRPRTARWRKAARRDGHSGGLIT